MSGLGQIAKEIEKKKNLEINLPKYMNTMMSMYYRYAHIHLSLSYYTWGEMLTEQKDAPESVKTLAESLNQIIRTQILQGILPEELSEGVQQIDSIRAEIIRNMKLLTDYTDMLLLYEYVLNRLEYQFNGAEFSEEYEDEAFANQMLQYILSDRDTVVVNARIKEIVGQLPLRMTRQRYFEIVRESFSLYQGEEKSNFDDMIYMLRSCAALEEPEAAGGEWKELHDTCEELRKADYNVITEQEWKQLTEQLKAAAEYVEQRSSLYMLMQEVVNDVYIILLSMPYALTEAGETDICRRLMQEALTCIESGAFEDENQEGQMEAFERLEGRQERLYEQISENEYLLDAMDDLEDTMKSIMVDKLYLSLKQMAKLSSSSMFVELHESRDTSPVTAEQIEKETVCFMEDMEASFRKNVKLVNRARMAATLQTLPAFFRSMEECQEYMVQSLLNCSDEREKLASVELIESIMEL